MAGTYHYKCVIENGSWSATAFGEMAEGMPECTGADMYNLEKAMVQACNVKSQIPGFTFQCDMVTPTTALFTACIGTARAGVSAAAGGAAPVAAAEAAVASGAGDGAAKAKAPEPEPEEEEEEVGFDLFD